MTSNEPSPIPTSSPSLPSVETSAPSSPSLPSLEAEAPAPAPERGLFWRVVLAALLALAVGLTAGYFWGRWSLEQQWRRPMAPITQGAFERSSAESADPTPAVGTSVIRPMPLARTRVVLRELTATDPVKVTVGTRDAGKTGRTPPGPAQRRGVRGRLRRGRVRVRAWNRPSPMNKGGEHYVAFQRRFPERRSRCGSPSTRRRVSQALHYVDDASSWWRPSSGCGVRTARCGPVRGDGRFGRAARSTGRASRPRGPRADQELGNGRRLQVAGRATVALLALTRRASRTRRGGLGVARAVASTGCPTAGRAWIAPPDDCTGKRSPGSYGDAPREAGLRDLNRSPGHGSLDHQIDELASVSSASRTWRCTS